MEKYTQVKNKKEWDRKVRDFMHKFKIPDIHEDDKEDKVLSYFHKDRIIAAWDFMDDEGWVMTESFFTNDGELHKIFDEL